ncbi:MAG TPA: cysteine--tRNA ligase [Blastocatellia bacterium]|nr:cysteine--tRNA ligase [Blastocatellia bacterium]HMV83957.1 cysteine--tRNA ligase [Blastocatellia bacterium]HMX24283.1 cysteine--tRNA ligase [Blastocatellia bacterium]HMY71034.1 cysteine--tRNA ligase [Blastocatellia bacterium]HMZ19446.1 cysteine--tRNA ligase [Blastocatellia bacterium]
MLKLYNTLTNQVEEFKPLEANQARMYVCGPTVHDFAHIGNFRTFLFSDLLRRYLKFKGFAVHHVMNITDVDDKIIKKSVEKGQSLRDYTEIYTQYFLEDFDALGAERPEQILRATDHIPEMVEIIKRLDANGHTYTSDGSTYFRINTFDGYGKLSKMNFEGNVTGASERVDSDEYEAKENARDFVLWKAVKPGEPFWETELGQGRPGWHIECSAMSMKSLGETFDIHAGGIDLVFPHHENEIAQSEGATGKPFVRYWVHAEFLMVEGQKMSKRLGNYYTFRDLMAQGYTPRAIRYLLLSAPHHKQLNFTLEGLRGAESTVARLNDFKQRLTELQPEEGSTPAIARMAELSLKLFEDSMDEDLNTAEALAAVHDFVRETNSSMAAGAIKSEDKALLLAAIDRFDSVFGVFGEAKKEMLDSDIQALIDERQAARKAKNFARSDEIRNQLTELGIILEDTKDGVRWRRK